MTTESAQRGGSCPLVAFDPWGSSARSPLCRPSAWWTGARTRNEPPATPVRPRTKHARRTANSPTSSSSLLTSSNFLRNNSGWRSSSGWRSKRQPTGQHGSNYSASRHPSPPAGSLHLCHRTTSRNYRANTAPTCGDDFRRSFLRLGRCSRFHYTRGRLRLRYRMGHMYQLVGQWP